MKIGAIQIGMNDNVIIAIKQVHPGDFIRYLQPGGRGVITVREEIYFGHKIALVDIESGEVIIKYNQIIGIASKHIKKGYHVHTHNIKSSVKGR